MLHTVYPRRAVSRRSIRRFVLGRVCSDPRITGYYRDQAAECEALATTTQSLRTRMVMLKMATRWRALADEHEGKYGSGPTDGSAIVAPVIVACPPLRPNASFCSDAREIQPPVDPEARGQS
jgi:hypothetical protein